MRSEGGGGRGEVRHSGAGGVGLGNLLGTGHCAGRRLWLVPEATAPLNLLWARRRAITATHQAKRVFDDVKPANVTCGGEIVEKHAPRLESEGMGRGGQVGTYTRVREPCRVDRWRGWLARIQNPEQLILGRQAPIRKAAQTTTGIHRIAVANAVGDGINLRISGVACHPAFVRCSCCQSWCM